jgi:NitT/TauT family transport system substrate-binding protein
MARAGRFGVVVLALALAAAAGTARAEVTELRIARQYGLPYLQFMVMEEHHLIEKQAAKTGTAPSVTWATLSDGTAVNDGILSGDIHLAAGGIGAFVTLWDKTHGGLGVKAMGALNSMPAVLTTRDASVKTVADFRPDQRLALPGVKVSPQAVTLQYEAAKLYGRENYQKFDPLTVNLPHPMAMQAMMSGSDQIVAHFATPPYSYYELKDKRVHAVLDSYDVWGGMQTLIVAWTTSKFRKENPKTYDAIVAALEEATAWINADKKAAAQLYLAVSKDKADPADILAILDDPKNEYTTTPKNIMRFAAFKHDIGTLKNLPKSWKELFFENVQDRAGS